MEFAKAGFAGLAESEKKLLSLICCKLLCAVAPAHVYEAVTAVYECGSEQFTAASALITEIDGHFRELQQQREAAQEERPVFESLDPEHIPRRWLTVNLWKIFTDASTSTTRQTLQDTPFPFPTSLSCAMDTAKPMSIS